MRSAPVLRAWNKSPFCKRRKHHGESQSRTCQVEARRKARGARTTTRTPAQRTETRSAVMATRRKGTWLRRAAASIRRRGTEGAFGKATAKKIRAGLRKGGIQAKRAAFAKAMKTIARRRRTRRAAARRRR